VVVQVAVVVLVNQEIPAVLVVVVELMDPLMVLVDQEHLAKDTAVELHQCLHMLAAAVVALEV
jgi:hypothetical protein